MESWILSTPAGTQRTSLPLSISQPQPLGAHHSRPVCLLNRTWDSEKDGQASFGKFAILPAPSLPEQRGGFHKGLLCFLLRLPERRSSSTRRRKAAPGQAPAGHHAPRVLTPAGPCPSAASHRILGKPSSPGRSPGPHSQGLGGGKRRSKSPKPQPRPPHAPGPFLWPQLCPRGSAPALGGGLPHSHTPASPPPLPWISTCPVKPQPAPGAGTARNGCCAAGVRLRGPRSPSPSALGTT